MFSIANPWIFLSLLLPPLVWLLLPRADESKQNALKVPFFSTIATITGQTQPTALTSFFKKSIAFLIFGLLVFAASGPQWLGDPIHLPQSGRDIMMAVDISGSMQLADMNANGQDLDRLQAVKMVANDFIQKRQGDRLGLILFGSRAYLQTPLTFDTQTVQNMLEDATIGLAGMQTAIGDGIGLSIKHLMEETEQGRVLILLTDGANNSGTALPIDAAKLAREHDIRIYTIGFDADQIMIPGLFGPQVVNPSSDLDESTLDAIAEITGGRYFRAKDTKALKEVYDLINALEPVNHEERLYRPIKPLYPWPLGIALLLSALFSLPPLLQSFTWRFKPVKSPLSMENR